jgi:acetylornithine deacetylase/succinyl-diaminopimelate desuccinylase-like protein
MTREAEQSALVARHAREQLPSSLTRLAEYLSIPAISSDKAHHGDVLRLSQKLQRELTALGFADARVLQLDGALPLTCGTRAAGAPGRPTLLIYGHLDLQPVRGENWNTPPHEATVIDGRLYARGAADDMGGWFSHLAALEAWLAVAGELPVNVKLVIEGEEEIGSPNLERYMDEYPEVFEADVMVLTDCENPSPEIPGLTVSLRGLFEVEVICESIEADVHSGLWGNMVPDPATALFLLIARLLDEHGRFALGRREVPADFREGAALSPPSREVIRRAARLLEGVEPLPDEGRPPAEWLWRQPALTILSTTLPRPDEQKNAIRRRASATLSIRLAPGQTGAEMQTLLEEVLLPEPPGGVRVSLVAAPGGAESWLYEPSGPVFDAVDRAYEKGFGRRLLRVGIGGSIPFVALFGRRFNHLPLVLNGVMDPETGAHGPNESLHLGVFEKAVITNVYLLDELSRLGESGGWARRGAPASSS